MTAIIAAVTALGLAFLVRHSSSDPGSLRRAAAIAAAAGDWSEVESALARLPALTSEDYLRRGEAALGRRDDEAALAHLARVSGDRRLAARARLLRGRIMRSRDLARAAEAEWLEAIRLDPSLTEPRRGLVQLYSVQLRRDVLLEQLAALVALSRPSPDLVLNWSISRREIPKPTESRPVLERLVAADPGDLASRVALADTLRWLCEHEAASEILGSLPNSDPRVRAVRARIALDNGDIGAASALLAEGPEAAEGLALLRARLALIRKDVAAAVRAARLADSARPNDLETLFVLALALRLAGASAEADRVETRVAALHKLRDGLARMAKVGERNAAIYRRIAEACEAADLIPEAVAWYRVIIASDPLDTGAQKAIFRLKGSSK